MSKEKEAANPEEDQLLNGEQEAETAEPGVEEASSNDKESIDWESEVAEAKDKYLRLYSEFENFRRRTSKEKIELISTASREIQEALLPVLDDFERALSAADDSGDLKKGIELIYSKFKNVLEGKGLKKMDIKPGDPFDDEFHEAISQIPPPKKKWAGKIVDVVEPGYFLGDKVLRFAKVVTGAKE